MRICPHCNQENPKDRVLCIHCGRNLEKQTKARAIINSVWGIIGGFTLILFDTDMVLSIGHVIPIPYGLSLIGISIILYYLENIINYVMPSSLLWADKKEQHFQIIFEESHVSRAVFLGLIAGVIPAFLWYVISTLSKYHFGVLAILVGWSTGKFVAIGSRQQRKPLLQITSVFMSLSILILTEYFIFRYFFMQTLEFSRTPIFLPLDTTIALVNESWKSEPITILFWIVSLVLAFSVPRGLYINKPYSEIIQKDTNLI